MIAWIMVAAVVGFLATFGLKLLPLYMEQIRVSNVLSKVEEEFSNGGATPQSVRKAVATRFAVNDIKVVKPSDLEVERGDGHYLIGFSFEQRTNFMGNVDLVVVFEKHVEAKSN